MPSFDYIQSVQNEISDIVQELGLKREGIFFRDALDAFKADAAFRIFIVDWNNFLRAVDVGEELGFDYIKTAVFYSYLIADVSTEKRSSFVKRLLKKKSPFDIDYTGIVAGLSAYVLRQDDFGDFCVLFASNERKDFKGNSKVSKPGKFTKLSLNAEIIINQVKKDPDQYRLECLFVAFNTHHELYHRDNDDYGASLFQTLIAIFGKCDSWNVVLDRLDALKQVEFLVDPEQTEKDEKSFGILLRLGIARGYLTYFELGKYGIFSVDQLSRRAFLSIGIDIVEKADWRSIV